MALQDYPDTPMSRMLRKAAKYVEPAMVLGSAAAATPVAGWAGILGGDVEKTRDYLTYQPRSAAGQGSMEDIGGAVGKVVDWADRNPVVGPVVRGYNKAADVAGELHPALGAAVRTAPEALMSFAGPGSAVTRAAFKNVAKATKGMPVGASTKLVTDPKYGIEVEGHHFSKAPRTELDPKAFGTGLKGSDRDAQLLDDVLKHQVSFYVPKKGRIVPEAGVGGIAHKSTLKDVYDVDTDPERLVGATRAITAANLQKAGYKGMLNRMEGDQPGQVIMFGPDRIPTTSLGSMSTIEGLADVPAGVRPAARGRDVQLEKLAALKDLPAGEMSPTSWGMMIKKRDPELHAALEPLGIFQPGGKPQYKDGLLRSIKDATEAPNYRADQAVVAHTNEAVPGASTGHRPDIVAGTEAEKLAYGAAAPWVDATGNDAIIAALRREQQPNIPTTGSYTNMAGVAENQPANIGRSMVDLNDVGASQIVPEGTAATTALAERLRGMGDAQEAYAAHIADTRPQAAQNALLMDTGGVQPSAQQLAAIKAGLPEGHDVTASPQGALAFPYDKGAAPQDLSAALRAFPGAKGVPARVDDSSMVYGPAIGKWGDDGVVPTAPFSGEATSGFLQAAADAPPEAAQALSASQRVRGILRGKTALDEGATGTREDIQNMRRFLSEADWNKAAEMIRAGAKPAAAVAALGYSINAMADDGTEAAAGLGLVPAAAAFAAGALRKGARGNKVVTPPRMTKAEAEAAGYWHPIGADKKLRVPVSEMSADLRAGGALAPRKSITPEDMYGGVLTPLSGDRSIAGQTLHGIGGNPFGTPVALEGGADFIRAQDPNNSMWASKGPVITKLSKRIQEAAKMSPDVFTPYEAMGHGSMDFNAMMADSVLEQVRGPRGFNQTTGRAFDKAMRQLRPDWPGLGSPDARKLLDTNGEVRKAFISRMGLKEFERFAPDMAATRHALTNPDLLDVPSGFGGYNVGRADPTGRIISNPVVPHGTYDTQIGGNYAGSLDIQLPREIMYPDFFKGRRAAGNPESGDNYSFLLAPPIQRANQEWLDRAMQYTEQARQLRAK